MKLHKYLLHLTKVFIYLSLSLASIQVFADVSSDFAAEAPYAKALNATKLKNSIDNFDPNQNIPGYTPNPEQTKYEKNPTALAADASVQSTTDAGAQAVNQQFESGQKYTIDPNSPSMKEALIAQQEAYNISHGVPDRYGDCQPSQECHPTFTTGSCTSSQALKLSCQNTLDVEIDYSKQNYECNHLDLSNPLSPQMLPGPDANNQCIAGLVQVTNQDFIKNKTNQIKQQHTVVVPGNAALKLVSFIYTRPIHGWFSKVKFTATAKMNVNNYSVVTIATRNQSQSSAETSMQALQTEAPINVNYYAEMEGGIVTPAIILEYVTFPKVLQPVINQTWVNSCANQSFLSQCQSGKQVCTQPTETRVINGVSVTEPCWQYTTAYTCGKESNDCQAYQGCDQIGSQCIAQIGSVCIQYKQSYQCQTNQCKTTGMICGGDFFCIDGNCSTPAPTQNKNFGKDSASLAAIAGAAEQFQGNPHAVKAFGGQAMSCSNTAFGYLNCCADSGWGKNIGLAKCSDEEKQLGLAKQKGLVVKVPNEQYCSHKVLGVCTETKKGYCAFPSKLAVDVQVGGRKDQLNIGFGNGKHPQCQGLTVDQIQHIDFSKIDFSNVAEDMKNNANFPDQQSINNAIAQHIHQEVGQ